VNKKPKYEIAELLKKYVEGTSTREEWEYLTSYLKKSGSPVDIDEALRQIWIESENVGELDDTDFDKILTSELSRDISIAKRSRIMILRWSAAAAVFAGLLIWLFWWNNSGAIQIYGTGYGENIEFVLDDGTKIYLNANSRLTWKKNWRKEGIRQVDLEGEAYFDVAHQEGHTGEKPSSRMPFEVYTPDLTIRVLGTSFNAVQRRGKTEVLLDEGVVELALHRVGDQGTGSLNSKNETIESREMEADHNVSKELITEVVKMEPGQWVSFSSVADELVQKTVESPESMTEWKEGTLFYRDVEFRFMLENLEDIYGKTFDVSDSALLQTRVDVGVPYEDWETVIDMMKWMLDVELIETGDNQVSIKRKEN